MRALFYFSMISLLFLVRTGNSQTDDGNRRLSLYEARGYRINRCFQQKGKLFCSYDGRSSKCSLSVFISSPAEMGMSFEVDSKQITTSKEHPVARDYGIYKFRVIKLVPKPIANIVHVKLVRLDAFLDEDISHLIPEPINCSAN